MMEHISLGNSCAIAYHLQHHNLRHQAYPFDWIQTPKISGLISLLQNNFADILTNLQIKNKSTNFPYLAENWQESSAELVRVVDTKYNLVFVHDFTQIEDLEQVKEKYLRRWKRFYQIMTDPTIEKRLYRIYNAEEDMQNLDLCLQACGFVNYRLLGKHYKEFGSQTSWKMEEYDWLSWFLD